MSRHSRFVIAMFMPGWCLLVLISGCSSGLFSPGASPRARRGLLDLRTHNFHTGGLVALRGEWEFHWKHWITPRSVTNVQQTSNAEYIPVPGRWNGRSYQGKVLGGSGFAGYRLRVLTGTNSGPLALQLVDLATRYRVFVNGRQVFSDGIMSTNEQQAALSYHPPAYIPLAAGPYEIVIHVANHIHKDGGIWNVPALGGRKAVQNSILHSMLVRVFLAGSLFLMGIYHLILFFFRRQEAEMLYFAGFCFMIVFRLSATEIRMAAFLLPTLFSGAALFRMEMFSIFLACPLFVAFMRRIFPLEFGAAFTRLVSGVCVFFTLVGMFVGVKALTRLVVPFQLVVLVAACYIIYSLVCALLQRRQGALIFLGGFLVLFATVINDILVNNYVFSGMFLIPVGTFVFILFQSLLLASRSTRAYRALEELSNRLDARVQERTNELFLKNRDLEHQLFLAQRIQRRFIPAQAPSEAVAFFYQPMYQVGGDFFDFIHFQDGRLGIFLSDVAGHGVPAAFVTSSIYGFNRQFGSIIDNPSEFLFEMNAFLYDVTPDTYVTACYIITGPEPGHLEYALAGHHAPILVDGSGAVSRLDDSQGGSPLGIFRNERLQSGHREYGENSMQASPGSRLLMFTDGLIEAVDSRDKDSVPRSLLRDFGALRFESLLPTLKGQPPRRIVESVVKELFHFRGSEEFDDDVCLICLGIE